MNNKDMPNELYAERNIHGYYDGFDQQPSHVKLTEYVRKDLAPAPKAVNNCPQCHGKGQYVSGDNELFNCDLCDNIPTPPNAARADEIAWVIELAWSEPSSPEYWNGGVGSFSWTKDNLRAVRFTRKEDAQIVVDTVLTGNNHRVLNSGEVVLPQVDNAVRYIKFSENSTDLETAIGTLEYIVQPEKLKDGYKEAFDFVIDTARRAETPTPPNAALHDELNKRVYSVMLGLFSLLNVCEGEWKNQGAWTEYDQSVMDVGRELLKDACNNQLLTALRNTTKE